MAAEGEKKIIVDEDWKSQVEREKETLAKQRAERPVADASAAERSQPAQAATSQAAQGRPQLPPASLSLLVSMFATQTLIALGQLPDPMTGKGELRADEARHFIDLIAVIEEKTTGNRTADESALIEQALHELRLAYVTVTGGQ